MDAIACCCMNRIVSVFRKVFYALHIGGDLEAVLGPPCSTKFFQILFRLFERTVNALVFRAFRLAAACGRFTALRAIPFPGVLLTGLPVFFDLLTCALFTCCKDE